VKDTTFLTAEEGGKLYWSEFFRWSLLVLVVNMGCRQGRVLGSEEAGSWSCYTHYTAAQQGRNINRQHRVCTQNTADCVWNVMAQAQKPYFVFRQNGRVHLNRRGASVHSTTGSRSVRISGSNAGYPMFRGSVKSTGYPLHSSVSPSFPLPCVTVCHQVSNALYHSNSCILVVELK
jgi:hypothetical protein